MKREREEESPNDSFVVFRGDVALEIVAKYMQLPDRARLSQANKRLYRRVAEFDKVIERLRKMDYLFRNLDIGDFVSIIVTFGNLEEIQYFLKRVLPSQYVLYIPVAAKYGHLHVTGHLLSLVQITRKTVRFVFETLEVLVKAKIYDHFIVDILQNGGALWWGDQGQEVVERCWTYATRICNDTLRETLRRVFPAFFSTEEKVYDAMSFKAAIETKDVKILSHYWELSKLNAIQKYKIGRGLYFFMAMNAELHNEEVIRFLQNKLKNE